MNNPNHHMNPSSIFQPCSPASFPHHHIHKLCPHHYHHHHHHHHHHGYHHHHSYSHLHHHHFNCHVHVFHSLAPPPPLQNPEPETSYPSQKVSNLGATANIHTQTSSSAIQVFHQPGEEQEEEGLLEQEEEEEEEDDDDDPVFILTDEWREFFARSEAKRQLEKKQRAKERRETSGNSFSSV